MLGGSFASAMADVSRSSGANSPWRSAITAIAELLIQNKLVSYVSYTDKSKRNNEHCWNWKATTFKWEKGAACHLWIGVSSSNNNYLLACDGKGPTIHGCFGDTCGCCKKLALVLDGGTGVGVVGSNGEATLEDDEAAWLLRGTSTICSSGSSGKGGASTVTMSSKTLVTMMSQRLTTERKALNLSWKILSLFNFSIMGGGMQSINPLVMEIAVGRGAKEVFSSFSHY